MNKNSRILICGEYQIINKGFLNRFKEDSFKNINHPRGAGLDLTSQKSVTKFFKDYKPEIVIFTGSVSGGIVVNIARPAEFIYKNIISQTNVFDSARKFNVKKLIFFASSCVYPKESRQPIKEEFLLTGSLEKTNEPYAIAKITGIKMCQAYNKQYGAKFLSIIPATIYGPQDDFNPHSSHVIAALIRRFYEAKGRKKEIVEIWGTGRPRREFIFVDDLVDACIFLIDNYQSSDIINVGCGQDISIKELALLIKNIIGFKGKVNFDKTKLDGAIRKLLDNSRITKLGWKPKTYLAQGIVKTYNWFRKNYSKI